MPELPEVETVRATLAHQLGNVSIVDVQVFWRNIIDQDLEEFERIKNHQITAYKRYGKYLVFECEELTLISHLRMEGKFYILETEKPYDKHVHVIFKLDNGKYLQYHDTRKFGKMKVVEKQEKMKYDCFSTLGKDAIDETIDYQELYKKWHPKNPSKKDVAGSKFSSWNWKYLCR